MTNVTMTNVTTPPRRARHAVRGGSLPPVMTARRDHMTNPVMTDGYDHVTDVTVTNARDHMTDVTIPLVMTATYAIENLDVTDGWVTIFEGVTTVVARPAALDELLARVAADYPAPVRVSATIANFPGAPLVAYDTWLPECEIVDAAAAPDAHPWRVPAARGGNAL